MEFWKENEKLRLILIAVLFIAGIVATVAGWRLTGQMMGLGTMIVGVICLLGALWVYNKPFERPHKKKV